MQPPEENASPRRASAGREQNANPIRQSPVSVAQANTSVKPHQNDCRDHALYYMGLGLRPIALQPGSEEWPRRKQPQFPLLPGWPEAPSVDALREQPVTHAEVNGWFDTWPNIGVGLLCGVGGFAPLEMDVCEELLPTPEQRDWERDVLPILREALAEWNLPITPWVQTARGAHIWFRSTGPVVTRHIPNLEAHSGIHEAVVKASQYVVAPPTWHECGAVRYDFAPYLSPWDVEIAELAECLREHHVSVPIGDELADWQALLPTLVFRGSKGRAHCPFHDDRKTSLVVWRAREGKLRWYCHAKCPGSGAHHGGDLADLWGRIHGRDDTATHQRAADIASAWLQEHLQGNGLKLGDAVVCDAARKGVALTRTLEGYSYRRLAKLSGLEIVSGPGLGTLSSNGRRIRKALGELRDIGFGVYIGQGGPGTKALHWRATALRLPRELRELLATYYADEAGKCASAREHP